MCWRWSPLEARVLSYCDCLVVTCFIIFYHVFIVPFSWVSNHPNWLEICLTYVKSWRGGEEPPTRWHSPSPVSCGQCPLQSFLSFLRPPLERQLWASERRVKFVEEWTGQQQLALCLRHLKWGWNRTKYEISEKNVYGKTSSSGEVEEWGFFKHQIITVSVMTCYDPQL